MQKQFQALVLTTVLMFSMLLLAQKPNIENEKFSIVTLSVKHSLKIINNKVVIRIIDRVKNIEISATTQDLEDGSRPVLYSKFKISRQQYQAIVKKIVSIDFDKFIHLSNLMPMDGYKCELEYGDFMNSIVLKASSPTNKTKERNLEDYLNVCNMIFDLVKMDNLTTEFKKK